MTILNILWHRYCFRQYSIYMFHIQMNYQYHYIQLIVIPWTDTQSLQLYQQSTVILPDEYFWIQLITSFINGSLSVDFYSWMFILDEQCQQYSYSSYLQIQPADINICTTTRSRQNIYVHRLHLLWSTMDFGAAKLFWSSSSSSSSLSCIIIIIIIGTDTLWLAKPKFNIRNYCIS